MQENAQKLLDKHGKIGLDLKLTMEYARSTMIQLPKIVEEEPMPTLTTFDESEDM